MTQQSINQELEAEIASVAEGCGCELVHAEFQAGVLRIFLDRAGGVTLSDCESVSRQLSPILDLKEFGSGRYVLEVSSPGLDRQLYRARDYQRFQGYRVRVTHRSPETRQKTTVVGKLEAYADDERGERIELRLEDGQDTVEIPLGSIQVARLEIDQDLPVEEDRRLQA